MENLRLFAFLIVFLSLATRIYSQLYEEELYRSIEEIEPIDSGTESASIADVVVLLLNLGSINALPVTGQISINSTTIAPVVTITNATQTVLIAVPTTEKPGFLKELFDEVIEEVEDFFDFGGDSDEVKKAAPVVNPTTTIHTQTVVIKNGLVVNETHTVETVNENTPIVTVLSVNPTTVAPQVVSTSDIKPSSKSTNKSSTTIRKKSALLPSNLFQKMMDILNQPDRIIPQIEVPEDSNIVVERFHY
ncbi:unnamed protein product [Diamesa serratosioi]